MLRYANSPQVVEDMVEINEKRGEWREHEVEGLLNEDRDALISTEQQVIRNRMSWYRSEEMLQYCCGGGGGGYGSLLGQTFAAMHPDRVGRLIIDGVLDPDGYYNGTWLANLQDSDKVLIRLCEYCFEAGLEECPLYTGKSTRGIESLVTQLVNDLKTDPIALSPVHATFFNTVVISFGDFYLRAIGAMAFPFSFPFEHAEHAEHFFELFAKLQKNNDSEIATLKQGQPAEAASLATCRTTSTGCMPERHFGMLWGTPVIECIDSAYYRNKSLTKDEFNSFLDELTKQSKWFSLT